MKSEFGFIEALRNRQKSHSKIIGIGDDCAVIPQNSKKDLVITADLLIEDIDFKLEWSKPEFIGHKSLAVSLSDIAAMGAKPVWSMTSIGLPQKIWKTGFAEKFYDGYLKLAKKLNVELIGGDISKTPEKIVIDSIVAGETKHGKAVLRSGAKVGDLIFVTGKLGGAALALELLESGERYETSKHKKLLERQLKPQPQTEIGEILGAKMLATAMIDLSDGLSSDLAHLCRESKIGAKIYSEKIPSQVQNSKSKVQMFRDSRLQTPDSRLGLNGGEDFELLFTVNPKKIFRLEKALEKFEISRIGEMTANVEIIELTERNESRILEPEGFRHF